MKCPWSEVAGGMVDLRSKGTSLCPPGVPAGVGSPRSGVAPAGAAAARAKVLTPANGPAGTPAQSNHGGHTPLGQSSPQLR